MSKTTARHRLDRRGGAIIGTTRKGRLARIASVTAVAGLLAGGLTVAAAPANAATVTNPSCAVPSSVAFQLTGKTSVRYDTGISRPPFNVPITIPATVSDWQATYNGVHYTGSTEIIGVGAPAVAAPNTVKAGTGAVVYAACQAG